MLVGALALRALGVDPVPLHGLDAAGRCSCVTLAARIAAREGRAAPAEGLPGCRPGKHPRPRGWQTLRALGGDALAELFGRYSTLPHNLGALCGGPAALVVLDVDGPTGRASLDALRAELGPLPLTRCSRSGRIDGGAHGWFRWPGGGAAVPRSFKLAPGLDVIGDGGLVVAPPSLHASGRRYTWAREAPIADLPTAWADRIAAHAPRVLAPPLSSRPEAGDDEDRRLRRARAYLRAMPPALSGQGGQRAAFDAAIALVRGFNLAPAVALDVLASDYNPRCEPPWSRAELEHKIGAAERAERVPRGYLLAGRR